MSVHVREKRGKLYLDIYHEGKRTWRKTGLTLSSDSVQRKESLRLAEILRSEKEHQLVAEANGLQDPVGSKQGLVAYAETVATTMPKTSHLKKSILYLKPFAGTLRLAAVDESFLERYREHLVKESGLAQQTAVNYFQALKTLLRRALRDRLTTRNAGENVKGISPPDSKRIALTAEEIGALAATDPGGRCGAEVRRAFLFSTQTGLRYSDLFALRWGDVERLPAPRLAMAQQKTGGMVFVPLNASAWRLIDDGALHRDEEHVFSIPAGASTAVFKRWARKAEITKKLSWHIGRHSYCVGLLEAGIDVYTASKLMGHRGVRQTEVYARATDGMKRRAVDALPEVSLGKGNSEVS